MRFLQKRNRALTLCGDAWAHSVLIYDPPNVHFPATITLRRVKVWTVWSQEFEDGVQEQNSKKPETEPRKRSKAEPRRRLTRPDVCLSAVKLLFRTRTGKWNLFAGGISSTDKGLYVREAMSQDSQAKRNMLRNRPHNCQQLAPP